jgi:regulator of protease activity HflC (stomatin/prohibitin superfamily)
MISTCLFTPAKDLRSSADGHITSLQIMNSFAHFITAFVATTGIIVLFRTLWRSVVTIADVSMNHRAIHSRHGKLEGILEPGRYRYFGRGHHFQSFDSRLQQVALNTQELTTAEGVTVKITVVGLYRIIDPILATSVTADYYNTLYTLIQLALRDSISGVEVESLLSNVRGIGPKMLETVQARVAALGLEVTELVVRDVIVPTEIKTAMSEVWRAKKTALAEIEIARGKAAVARTLANTAKLYEDHPSILKVRYIEALEHATKGIGNTFVIGMPDDKALKQI